MCREIPTSEVACIKVIRWPSESGLQVAAVDYNEPFVRSVSNKGL